MINHQKLKNSMETAGLSSRSLAIKAGLPHATVWRTVKGITTPNIETLVKISNVLELSIDEVLIEHADQRKAA